MLGHDGRQLVHPGGRQVQRDGGDVLVFLELYPALGRGQDDLPRARGGQLGIPAPGGELPGYCLDEPAGPERGITQAALDLVPDHPLPALAGHPGAFGAAVDHGLGGAEVVAVQVGVRDGLQRVDVHIQRCAHVSSFPRPGAAAASWCFFSAVSRSLVR